MPKPIRALAGCGCRWIAVFLLAILLHSPTDAFAGMLSPLAGPPAWEELERFQNTISRAEFTRLLDDVYAPNQVWNRWITIRADGFEVIEDPALGTKRKIRFAPDALSTPPPRFWRGGREFPAVPLDRPLQDVRIAIDPGHIGGKWARMEERWFALPHTIPVTEGDLTLAVAKHLTPLLEKLGAKVTLVRDTPEPVTENRPETLHDIAREDMVRQGYQNLRENYSDPADPTRGATVQYQSELMFYRISEIRARAKRVNEVIQPDLVLCLHFNATGWADPNAPEFETRNDFHVLVNGCYSAGEIRFDDQRFEMLYKLLSRNVREEIPASEAVVRGMVAATDLPPWRYSVSTARQVGSDFVWARNLLANRLYRAPVVFLEPYIMNHWQVWERVQAGDYEGERLVAGRLCKSLVREYAEGVATGIALHFLETRPHPSK